MEMVEILAPSSFPKFHSRRAGVAWYPRGVSQLIEDDLSGMTVRGRSLAKAVHQKGTLARCPNFSS